MPAQVSADPAATGPSVPDLGALGWQPVLDENFDGDSLDETVWNIHEGRGLKEGFYNRDAVRIEEDPDEPGSRVLSLTAYTDDDGEHRSGVINTGDLATPMWSGFRSAYGYVEARIQINDRPGMTSTFWTMPDTSHPRPYGDPAAGGPEIDILESMQGEDGEDGICNAHPELGVPCNERHRANLHWGGFEEGYDRDGLIYANPSDVPLQGNYHDYSLLWTPEGYYFYLDGIEVYRTERAAAYSMEHFILGQYIKPDALPSDWDFGDLDESTNKMLVDYVKVWQRPVSETPDQTVGQGGSVYRH